MLSSNLSNLSFWATKSNGSSGRRWSEQTGQNGGNGRRFGEFVPEDPSLPTPGAVLPSHILSGVVSLQILSAPCSPSNLMLDHDTQPELAFCTHTTTYWLQPCSTPAAAPRWRNCSWPQCSPPFCCPSWHWWRSSSQPSKRPAELPFLFLWLFFLAFMQCTEASGRRSSYWPLLLAWWEDCCWCVVCPLSAPGPTKWAAGSW